jgi:dTDP-4-dehydrorhamnose 3,5-epimerase
MPAAAAPLRIEATPLPGCYELFMEVFRDPRGYLVKTFNEALYSSSDLATRFAEEYYSVSRRRVLRGLHFQVPPHDHAKAIFCTAGEVLDAAVDLREGSPAFGRHHLFRLSARRRNIVYLPAGIAHGFYVTSAGATLVYRTTAGYSADHDRGVRWDSAGIVWPDRDPILSERDRSLPALRDFASPFRYHA